MRGKLRPRVARKAKDWDDVLWTICQSGLSSEEVIAMTPSQRAKAKAEAYKTAAEEYWARHREREATWVRWASSTDPDRASTWKDHCEKINRMDLHRAHCLSASGHPFAGGPPIHREEEYE